MPSEMIMIKTYYGPTLAPQNESRVSTIFLCAATETESDHTTDYRRDSTI